MNKTETTAGKRLITPLEEMNVIDDFLFYEMLYDEKTGEEVCRIILEKVLKRRIGEVNFTPQKMIPGISQEAQGIRLDAYITEKTGDSSAGPDIMVHDLEPDKRKSKKDYLTKRCRYYSDLIDVQIVNTGVEYEKLPEVVIIFILSYDPFDSGDMYYEAKSMLKTHPDIPYDDGVRRIYLYTDGKLPENPDDSDIKLKNLLQYIRRSTEENITDETTRRLDDIVKATKHKKDVGIRYMKSWELERELKEEGREEGREEERANTEAERRRADAAEAQVDQMKAELAKYKEKFGII
ncbi:MAG: Rpn family recombination-promoting nuclease/putative transposase [Lachnospiraceae bacterium]|nr:Rpn family recombination-promoting nuclease/putative transposase [Lachnospiraceae bacterium]